MKYWAAYFYHRVLVGHSKVAARIHSELYIAGEFLR